MEEFLLKTSKLQGRYKVTRTSIHFGDLPFHGTFYYGTVKPWNETFTHFYVFHQDKVVEFPHEVDFELDRGGEYHLYFDNLTPKPNPSETNLFVGSIKQSITTQDTIFHKKSRLRKFNMIHDGGFYRLEYKKSLSITDSLLTVYLYPGKDPRKLATKISELYIDGFISYPFKRLIATFPSIEQVRSYRSKFDGSQSEIDDVDDYEINIITDKYSEKQRLSANVKGHIKPIDALKDPSIVLNIIKGKSILTPLQMRDELYVEVREATQFKVCLAKAVIDVYCKGGTYMDMSMGWGDRLIGALASGVKHYIGFDPNTSLQSAYKEIVKDFNQETKVSLHAMPYQDMAYRNVDLCFTSPPYFDFEEYSEEDTQSYSGIKNYKQWVSSFYKPMMDVSWNSLRAGGRLVLHLGNTNRTPTLVQDAISHMLNTYSSKHTQIFLNKRISLYLWTKPDLNPPFEIEAYFPLTKVVDHVANDPHSNLQYRNMAKKINTNYNHKVLVINDNHLQAGTKQRGWKFIEKLGGDFYIVSTPYGYGQIAAALLAKQFGYKVRIYIEKLKTRTDMTNKAISLGAEIVEITGGQLPKAGRRNDSGPRISGIQKYADERETYIKLPFGFDSDEYIEYLSGALKEADTENVLKDAKSIWVAGGSGTVAKALRLAFPNPKLNLVRIGREINAEIENSQIWDNNNYSRFFDKVSKGDEPPYPSLLTYDAKVWIPAVIASWFNKDKGTVIFNIA